MKQLIVLTVRPMEEGQPITSVHTWVCNEPWYIAKCLETNEQRIFLRAKRGFILEALYIKYLRLPKEDRVYRHFIKVPHLPSR